MRPFCLLWLASFGIASADVKFLIAVWRHGDRAPEQLPYPNDPHNETFWPRGWNQLTNIGIKQATMLGVFLRRRYMNSVLGVFDRKLIEVRSTDADRAIETAQSVCAKLFPPSSKQRWDQSPFGWLWQPIPIRTNGKYDPMLRPSKITCDRYQELTQTERKIIEAEVNQKYRNELEMISNYTGHNTRFANIKDVYNIILEHYNGLPLPEWSQEVVNGKPLIDTIIEIRRIGRLQLFNSREKSKFMAGFLINNIAENLILSANNQTSKRALLHSSHDGTVSSLLYGLNISNHQLVPYTACLLVELHTDNTVKVFLRNTTTEDPGNVHQLKIPGCPERCQLSTFLGTIEDVRIKSIDELKLVCSSAMHSICFLVLITLIQWSV